MDNLKHIENQLLNHVKIKALVNCNGKVHKRYLRLVKTEYSATGYDIVCTTPKYRSYHLKEHEIIKIL